MKKKFNLGVSVMALFVGMTTPGWAAGTTVTGNSTTTIISGDTDFFTNPGFSITPTSGDSVDINGNVAGNVANSGSISAPAGIHGVNIAGNVGGSITNSGTIAGGYYGIFVDGNIGGNFDNTGKIKGGGSGVFIDKTMIGNFTNSGTITGTTKIGVDFYQDGNGLQGSFNNSGHITGGSIGVYSYYNIAGDFKNSGTIEGGNYGIYVGNGIIGGNFTNSGNIEGGRSGIFIDGAVAGNFTNTGNITGTTSSSFGVRIDGPYGSFNNSGHISGGGDGVYSYFNIAGDFTNSGVITGGDYGIYTGHGITGNFVNSGNITGTTHDGVYSYYGMNGNATNSGKITGGAYGIHIYGGDIGGSFTNSGTITGTADDGFYSYNGINGNFTNSGKITGGAYGVHIEYGDIDDGGIGGSFTNSGTITGTADDGFYSLYGIIRGGVTNSGKIIGGEYGVHIADGGILGGDFTNSGTITGAADDGFYSYYGINGNVTNSGKITGGVSGIHIDDGGIGRDFTNSGNITGTADDGFYSNYGISGNVTNSGRITGGEDGFSVDAIGGNFTNSGEIIGTADDGFSSYYGVYKNFTNSGNITGGHYGIYVDNGGINGNFTNSGNITAGIGYTALQIAGNLGGDFINTGNMTVNPDGFAARIDGKFAGNYTSTVGQGLQVSDSTNIIGKTVTAWVNQYVAADTTWVAIRSGDIETTLSAGDPIADNSPLVNVTVAGVIEDVDLVLTTTRNRIVPVSNAGGGQHLGLGGVVDGVIDADPSGASFTTNERKLIDVLYSQQSDRGVAEALNAFSPQTRGPTVAVAGNSQMLMDTLLQHQLSYGSGAAAASPYGGLPLAYTNDFIAEADAAIMPFYKKPSGVPVLAPETDIWAQVVGGGSHLGADGVTSGYNASTFGFVAGAQRTVYAGFSTGGALGYLNTHGTGSANSFTVQSIMPAAYARYGFNAFYLLGAVSGGYHSIDQSRDNPFINQHYSDSYSGADGGLHAELGYDARLGPASTLTPFIAGNYRHVWIDGFNEAGNFGLSVGSQGYDFGSAEVGLKASGTFGAFTLAASGGYRDDLTVHKGNVAATIAGLPAFGTQLNADLGGGFATADVRYAIKPGMTASLSLSGQYGDHYSYGAAKLGLDWTY